MPSSRFTGLYLSGRALAVLLAVVGVAGAMAFYRAHTTPAAVWAGMTGVHSTEGPLAANQVSALTELDKEQELLAQHVAEAVVAVNVTAHAQAEQGGPGGLPPDNPLSQFFGQFGQMPRRPQFDQGLGSGIIISPDGYIVTNNHVVENATDITVTLQNKKIYKDAKVIGTDPLTDLAVIKIDATGLPNLPWGDSHALKQGDNVFAVGNPFQLNFTVTRGIVSGKGRINFDRTDRRQPGDYIQTDAAINPGNSGGPLVNARGEVIGVNAFIYTSTGSFSGEAFAIPSEIAKPIAATLISKGKVVRGYLGITIEDMTPEEAHFFNLNPNSEGALVTDVTAGAAGAKGGLKVGDFITSLNGQKVSDSTGLQLATGSVPPDTPVKVDILRDGKPMTLTITLGIAPQDQPKSASSESARPASTGVQLGINYSDIAPQDRDRFQLPDELKGAIITGVTPGGPGFIAQLGPGEVITDVNRVPVASADELRAQLQKLPPGQDVLLRVVTGGDQPGGGFVVVHPTAHH